MRALVIAPHPDDEMLGCGGTLLALAAHGVTVGWLIVTEMNESYGWASQAVAARQLEIKAVRESLGISDDHLYQLSFPPAKLDTIPLGEVIEQISRVISEFRPSQIFVPHSQDAHSDHRICFEAVTACTKWFRNAFIKRVLSYETLSETDAAMSDVAGFRPTVYVNISEFLQKKCDLLQIYESEMGTFPFPRSEKAVKALAWYRGSQSGFEAAEAFTLLREHADVFDFAYRDV